MVEYLTTTSIFFLSNTFTVAPVWWKQGRARPSMEQSCFSAWRQAPLVPVLATKRVALDWAKRNIVKENFSRSQHLHQQTQSVLLTTALEHYSDTDLEISL